MEKLTINCHVQSSDVSSLYLRSLVLFPVPPTQQRLLEGVFLVSLADSFLVCSIAMAMLDYQRVHLKTIRAIEFVPMN